MDIIDASPIRSTILFAVIKTDANYGKHADLGYFTRTRANEALDKFTTPKLAYASHLESPLHQLHQHLFTPDPFNPLPGLTDKTVLIECTPSWLVAFYNMAHIENQMVMKGYTPHVLSLSTVELSAEKVAFKGKDIHWKAFDGAKVLDALVEAKKTKTWSKGDSLLWKAIEPKADTIRAFHSAFVTPLVPDVAVCSQIELAKGALEEHISLKHLYGLAVGEGFRQGEDRSSGAQLLLFLADVVDGVMKGDPLVESALPTVAEVLFPLRRGSFPRQVWPLRDNITKFPAFLRSEHGKRMGATLHEKIAGWRDNRNGPPPAEALKVAAEIISETIY